MEQKRVPEAAPEWPSVELGIGEKRSFRKGSKSAFKSQFGYTGGLGARLLPSTVWVWPKVA